jgi:NAD(P)-dependent dehydrogenase (short-subunit alcohol dehydrogenase family)
MEKQFFTTARTTSLLKRFETPEEIANIVAFVAGNQSNIINGAALRADGGVLQSIF